MKLETKLESLLPVTFLKFDVIAYELTNDGNSWSVNTPFKIASHVDRESAIEILRARWEIFKLNYYKKARVSDLTDISEMEGNCELEVDCIPFAQVNLYPNS